MNGIEEPARWLAEAHRALERAETLLLEPTPRNIEVAGAAMGCAAGRLEFLRLCFVEQPGCDPALLESTLLLRTRIETVTRLLEHAAGYHSDLLQEMMAAAHTATPSTSPRQMDRRVLLDA